MVQLLVIHGADPAVTAVDLDGGEFTARSLAQHMGYGNFDMGLTTSHECYGWLRWVVSMGG